MDRSRTAEKVVSEQIPERRMGASHVVTCNIPGRGNAWGEVLMESLPGVIEE